MAQTKYTYSIATDTANGAVVNDKLRDEIHAQGSGVTISVDTITTTGDVLDIYMADIMPDDVAGASASLAAVVSAHDGINLVAPKGVEIIDQTPFAKPDYRTKRESNGSWVTCLANSNTDIDYLLTEERYATGGEVIFKDAKEGDYVSACVYDKDGVIPETYRTALCENHPVVAEYIVQKFLEPTEAGGYGKMVCDTYPLSAKISAGLYLRVTYHATSETGDRKAVVNYNLNKKL